MTTNPTDPAAVEAWRTARGAHSLKTWAQGKHSPEAEPAAATVIQSYGDQREAAARADERERVADRIAELEARVALLTEALNADCTVFPSMEEKLIEVAARISGLHGEKPCHPDPVILSEWVAEINLAALRDAGGAKETHQETAYRQSRGERGGDLGALHTGRFT